MEAIDDKMKLMMCFDDKLFANSIETILKKKYPLQISKVKQCRVEELIKSINKHEFDYNILFLDMCYESAGPDGIQIGMLINKLLPDCTIMYFVDDYNEIPQIYDVTHYCLCKKTDAQAWLDHFISRLIKDNEERLKNQYLELVYRRRHIIICQVDVQYIERKNRMIEVHTCNKVYSVYSSIKKMYEQLNSLFERCHGSFIVNTRYVKKVDGNEIVLQSGTIIPLGETYKKKFESGYRSYVRDNM